MKRATAFVDGGVRGTPGPHACAVVMQVDGESICFEHVRYLGPEGTNNQAEYGAVLLALEMAREEEITHLVIRSDSKLVVEQVLGKWRVKESSLQPLCAKAQELARGFDRVLIKHVPRGENKRADALCTDLLDSVTGRKRGS